MSLIIGLHLGNIVLLAADKRVMDLYGNRFVFNNDEHEKIIDAGLGYVTGSGVIELLDNVKDSLANADITNTNQIMEIINREKERFLYSHWAGPEWAAEQIKKTGWMFTYSTKSDSQTAIRIGMVHGSWNDDLIRLLHKGTAMVFVPIDGNGEESERLSEILTQSIKTTNVLTELTEIIPYHVRLLQPIFEHVSDICPSVSKAFHVAVHTNDGMMIVSEEISPDTTNIQFSGKSGR